MKGGEIPPWKFPVPRSRWGFPGSDAGADARPGKPVLPSRFAGGGDFLSAEPSTFVALVWRGSFWIFASSDPRQRAEGPPLDAYISRQTECYVYARAACITGERIVRYHVFNKITTGVTASPRLNHDANAWPGRSFLGSGSYSSQRAPVEYVKHRACE